MPGAICRERIKGDNVKEVAYSFFKCHKGTRKNIPILRLPVTFVLNRFKPTCFQMFCGIVVSKNIAKFIEK